MPIKKVRNYTKEEFIFELPEFLVIEKWVKSISPTPEEEIKWDYKNVEESRAKVVALIEKLRVNLGARIELPAGLGNLVFTDTQRSLHKPGNPLFTIWEPGLPESFYSLSGGKRWEDHGMRGSLAEQIALKTGKALNIRLRELNDNGHKESDSRLIPKKAGVHKLLDFGVVYNSNYFVLVSSDHSKVFITENEAQAFDVSLGIKIINEDNWYLLHNDGYIFEV